MMKERQAALAQLKGLQPEGDATIAGVLSTMQPLDAVFVLTAYIEHEFPYTSNLLAALLLSSNALLGDLAVRYSGQQGPEVTAALLTALPEAHAIVQVQILLALEKQPMSGLCPP